MVTESPMERRQAGGGSVKLWAVLCGEILGPGIHLDAALTCITYLNIFADRIHFVTAAVFLGGRIMLPVTPQKLFRNSLRKVENGSKH